MLNAYHALLPFVRLKFGKTSSLCFLRKLLSFQLTLPGKVLGIGCISVKNIYTIYVISKYCLGFLPIHSLLVPGFHTQYSPDLHLLVPKYKSFLSYHSEYERRLTWKAGAIPFWASKLCKEF